MSDHRLESLELYHFVGMELGGITRFKMKPQQDKIVILGSNGAGKSRLLKVIPPHALSPLDLLDDGYAIWVYKVGSVSYRFEQRKKGKNLRCSVYKDDVAVVEHANPTVYNDAVTNIFGYDKKAKELLTSAVRFNQMNTTERRFWFGQLAASDLTTALKYYKVAKEQQRDCSGAIKITERYISDMKPLVLKDSEELESLNKRLIELESEYEIVNKEWLKYNGSEGTLEVTLEEMQRINEKVMGLDVEGVKDTGYYQSIIHTQTAALNHSLQFIIPRLSKELTNLENELKEAEYYAKNLDVFEERIKEIKGKIAALKNTDNVFLSETIVLPMTTLRGIVTETDKVQAELLREQGRQTSDEKLSVLQDEVKKHQTIIDELNAKQTRDQNVLYEIDKLVQQHIHTEDIDCPECKARFKPGVRGKLNDLEAQAVKGRTIVEQREVEIATAREHYTVARQALDAKEDLVALVKRLQSGVLFTSLINHLLSSNGFNRSTNITMWFDEYKAAAVASVRILELEEELRDFEQKQMIAAAASGRDKKTVEAKVNELSESLQSEKDKVAELETEISHLKVMLGRAETCETYEKRLEILVNGIDATIMNQGRFFYADYLSKSKDKLWELISGIRERKATLDKVKEELEYNEKKVADLRESKIIYDEIVREMSPSDGILAEYLYRSIYAVTDSMNLLIEQVFNYPLVVKPCDVEDGELDYTFPFVEGESGTTRRDVSIGSDAQKEIFDNTFLLSAIQALDVRNQPLMLDEPGRTMDVGHKQMYSDFIASLCGTEYCSQLFVVSHNKEFHSRLGAVDYVVLREDGVDLPDTYNECVEIEYDS